jgi:hypothetical protein
MFLTATISPKGVELKWTAACTAYAQKHELDDGVNLFHTRAYTIRTDTEGECNQLL